MRGCGQRRWRRGTINLGVERPQDRRQGHLLTRRGGTDIGELTDRGTYYVRETATPGVFQFYHTHSDAINNLNAIHFTSAGSGGHQIVGNSTKFGTQSAASNANASAPSASNISDRLNLVISTPPGTTADVETGAVLTAGGNIGVKANESDHINVVTGQIAGGIVGIGAAVSIVSLGDNVAAFADGTLSAGGQIAVNAILDEHFDLHALDGSAGGIAIGAGVVAVTDTSLAQASLGNVTKADDVTVNASNTRNVKELTGMMQVGAVGAGASYTEVDLSGGASAAVDGSADIGQTDTVGSLTVSATSNNTLDVHAVAVSGGVLLALAVNFAFATDTSSASATIEDGADVKVSNDIHVTAAAIDNVDTLVEGFAGGGGLSVGASITKSDVETPVTASIGTGSTAAGNIYVKATTNDGLGPDFGASAESQASAGGFIGAVVPFAKAIMLPTVEAAVKSNVNSAGVVEITAVSNNHAVAKSQGVAGGLAGVGASIAEADTGGSTKAHLDGSVANGSNPGATNLTIKATGTETASATAQAVTGGLFSGQLNDSQVHVTPSVSAYISSGGSILTSGNIDVEAVDHPEGDAITKGVGGGFVNLGGSTSYTNVQPTVLAYIDPPAVHAGGSITVSATADSIQTNPPPDYKITNADGGNGDLINPLVADPLNNTIEVDNHGLQTGDTVQVPDGAVGGLVSNAADRNGTPIALRTVIAADPSHLAFGAVFDGASVDPATDVITTPSAHNLKDGDLVEYEPVGTGIGGLNPGQVYKVLLIDGTHIKLRILALPISQRLHATGLRHGDKPGRSRIHGRRSRHLPCADNAKLQ